MEWANRNANLPFYNVFYIYPGSASISLCFHSNAGGAYPSH